MGETLIFGSGNVVESGKTTFLNQILECFTKVLPTLQLQRKVKSDLFVWGLVKRKCNAELCAAIQSRRSCINGCPLNDERSVEIIESKL